MRSRVWGMVLVVSAALAVPIRTSATQCPQPEVAASPASAAAGDSVTVSGKNFGCGVGQPDQPVGKVALDLAQGTKSYDLGTADIAADGSFNRSVTVPGAAVPGGGLVSATGGGSTASTGFTVTGATSTTTVTTPTPQTATSKPSTLPTVPLLRSTATTKGPTTTLTTIAMLQPVATEPETTTSEAPTTSTSFDRRNELAIRNAGDNGPPVWLVALGGMTVAAVLAGAGYLLYRRRQA